MNRAFFSVARCVVATSHAAVRDFLLVQLQDRGFAVELAHRVEYLQVASEDADLLIADCSLWESAELTGQRRPRHVIALSENPSPGEADRAQAQGARAYLCIPFLDPRGLAELLDEIQEELRQPLAKVDSALKPWSGAEGPLRPPGTPSVAAFRPLHPAR